MLTSKVKAATYLFLIIFVIGTANAASSTRTISGQSATVSVSGADAAVIINENTGSAAIQSFSGSGCAKQTATFLKCTVTTGGSASLSYTVTGTGTPNGNAAVRVSGVNTNVPTVTTSSQTSFGGTTCSHQCSGSEKECTGTTQYKECTTDGNGCRIWGTVIKTCTGAVCFNNNCCTPKTCTQLGKNCDQQSDTCGGTINCGGCTTTQYCNNGVCTPKCGNGIIDSGEQCDGTNLNGKTCIIQGFSGGTLSCSSSCQFNTQSCTACNDECTPAGTTCSGDNKIECSNSDTTDTCLEKRTTACGTGKTCYNSNCCTKATCSAGECDSKNDNCGGTIDCGSCGTDQYCSSGSCVNCNHECTTAQLGTKQCQDSNTPKKCVNDANSCRIWQDQTDCTATQTCSTGNCVAACSNDAGCDSSKDGLKRCSGNTIQTCRQGPGDTCWHWQDGTTCTQYTQYCSSGVCNECPNKCSIAGTKECVSDDSRIRECKIDATSNCRSWVERSCGGSQVCRSNECITPPRCGDNAKNDAAEVCDGTDLAGKTCQTQGFAGGTLRCASNCQGFDTSSCCSNDAGCSSTSDLKCSGINIQRCNNIGGCLKWVADTTCGEGQTCYNNNCCTKATCSAGECGSKNDNCGGTTTCICEADERCDAGSCVPLCTNACTGDERECDGGYDYKICKDSDGDGCTDYGSPKPCPPEAPFCVNGVCKSNIGGGGASELGVCPIWVPDSKYEGGFYFKDYNSYITLMGKNELAFGKSKDFTISFWAKAKEDYGGENKEILRNQFLVSATYIVRHHDDKLKFLVNGIELSAPDDPLDDLRWHQIVVMRKGAMGKIYDNGNEIASGPISDSGAGGSELIIGSLGASGWKGKMDQVRIWKRALTPEEIKLNYQSNLQRYGVNHWVFQLMKNDVTDGQSYTFQAVSQDIDSNQLQTEQRSVTLSIPATTLAIRFPKPSPINADATPSLAFIPPTPTSTITANALPVHLGIINPNLQLLTFTLDSNNYNLYDDSLVLMMNFEDSREIIEDTDAPNIKDDSLYKNVGLCKPHKCPNDDFSVACCTLNDLQMWNYVTRFNKGKVSLDSTIMFGRINKFKKGLALC